jgi:hypothetical protein
MRAPYQHGAARQKNALPTISAPFRTPEILPSAAARFDPLLTPCRCFGAINDTKPDSQARRAA